MSFRRVEHCLECDERYPVCSECGCCEECCECEEDLFTRSELGLDPEEDEYEYRRRHQ